MNQSWPDALPGGHSISGYVIDSVIGRGGFGITYAALNPVLGRRVCIKEFFPQGLARRVDGARLEFNRGDAEIANWAVEKFKVTTRALCDLSHPNIVKVFDYVPANNTGYMAMELLEGRTLSDWLEANPKPTLEQLRPVIEPIMEALTYVHGQGLIHRDVAPDNIFVTHDGRPVLIDFGSVSRELAQQGRASTVSTYKAFYAAPEQTTPRTVPGLSADIYSLGAVLHLAIAGEPPPDSRERVGAVALGDNPDPYAPLAGRTVEGWPREALAAVDSALSLDRRKRPQSVEALRHALRRRETPAAAPAGGWRMAAVVAVTAVIAGAGSIAVWEGIGRGGTADGRTAELERRNAALSADFEDLRTQLRAKDAIVQQAQTERDEARRAAAERPATPAAQTTPPPEPRDEQRDAASSLPDLVPIKGQKTGWTALYEKSAFKLVDAETYDQTYRKYRTVLQGSGSDTEISIEVRPNPSCMYLRSYTQDTDIKDFNAGFKSDFGDTIGNYQTFRVEGSYLDGRLMSILLAQNINDRSSVIVISAKYRYVLAPIYSLKVEKFMRSFQFPPSTQPPPFPQRC